MTSDCYAILGVTPAAEDVVIGAAYRALMRHYHPDTNPDPTAQARAREITAAYAVLRDPSSRARYDALRAGPEPWKFDEPAVGPPPMRAVGLATAILAVALVGAVWSWTPPSPRPSDFLAAAAARTSSHPPVPPEIELKPESERLAILAGKADPKPAADDVVAAPTVSELPEPVAEPAPPPRVAASPQPVRAKSARAAALVTPPKPAAPDKSASAKDERVATLTRMSAGFFSQSMANADAGKKALLIAAHDRSAAERKACRSDSCVAEAYVRQIRATSAIMESHPGPAN